MALRAVVISDRDVASATLCWRQAGTEAWRRVPMARRFRDSYAVTVPGTEFAAGTIEFYVSAVDGDGNAAAWPITGNQLPWSVSVLA